MCPASGLSPHVRGNLERWIAGRGSLGSIPACTGKPGIAQHRDVAPQVYPRMYGETAKGEVALTAIAGLSPHVRGNPWVDQIGDGWRRSIPACTGKPQAAGVAETQQRVYPRMYGETPASPRLTVRATGLSPHVRGNL